MTSQTTLTIGALAKRAGVGVETVRFYERKGIIRRPPKGSGYRQYSAEESRRIQFVKRAQELGFTLKEIKDLLEMNVGAGATCGEIKSKADSKIAEIEAKIADLKRMKASVQRLSEACGTSKTAASKCRVLDCFERDWKC